jgi:hypothetical protein
MLLVSGKTLFTSKKTLRETKNTLRGYFATVFLYKLMLTLQKNEICEMFTLMQRLPN